MVQKLILIGFLLLVILIVCGAMGIPWYQSVQESVIKMGIDQAQMASAMVALEVDKEVLKGLKPGCEDTEEYQSTLTMLRSVKEEYELHREAVSQALLSLAHDISSRLGVLKLK